MDSITIWTWSLIAGGVVILIVAVLLIAIAVTARRIDKHAQDVWIVGKSIARNTASIWLLDRTNQVAGEILASGQAIDADLKSLAGSLGK